MTAGKTLKLTLNCGASSGISWTTSNSKTVAITSRSKNYVYLKAVKKGTAVVRAKYKTSQVYPAGNKGFEICKGDLVTGEGWFVHTILPFDWKKSHNYRALLQLSNPPDGSNSHLFYYVCDLHTGAWTKLVEYDLGYNDVQMNRCVSFLEDFSYGMAGYPRSMALSNYRVHPTGSGTWAGTNKAVMDCYYSNNGSYQYGSSGNAFWAITTGIGGRCYTPQKNLTCYVNRYETGQPY